MRKSLREMNKSKLVYFITHVKLCGQQQLWSKLIRNKKIPRLLTYRWLCGLKRSSCVSANIVQIGKGLKDKLITFAWDFLYIFAYLKKCVDISQGFRMCAREGVLHENMDVRRFTITWRELKTVQYRRPVKGQHKQGQGEMCILF